MPGGYETIHDRWQREAQEYLDQAKEQFFAGLKQHPLVVTVTASYDGSNDEGHIDAISFLDASGTELKVSAEMDGLAEVFVGLAVDAVAGSGWGDGDGNEGTVMIEVPSRKTTVYNRAKYTAYDESTGEL